MKTAYFTATPRTLEDLRSASDPHPYEIVGTVELEDIDYENFITDMLADREFIEPFYDLCEKTEEGVWRCILVQGPGEGVLIFPCDESHVGWVGV